jgi:hypothetical protein
LDASWRPTTSWSSWEGAVYNPAEHQARFYKGGDGYDINTVQCLDLKAPEKGWYELPPIPRMGRTGFGAVAIGSKVYLFGGACYNTWTHGNLLTFLGDAYVLDVETLRWRQLRELPAPLWSVSAVAYENRFIILAGGHRRARHDPPDELYDLHRAPEGPNLDVLVYDPELDFYQTLPSKFPAFHITEETRQEIARMRLRNPPSDWTNRFDFSQGGRRVLPGITVVQGLIYVTGSSVDVTEANATDDFLIGTVVR